MDPLEIGPLRSPRLDRRDGLTQIGSTHAFEHGIEPLRALWMARPGKMLEVGRMSGEQHGHAVGRYLATANSGLPFALVKPAMHSVTGAPLILRAGGVVACVRPWAFEPNVAHLVLYNQGRLPRPADILAWIGDLGAAGFDTIRTGALGVQAGARFERLGFESVQSLVLLEHTSINSVDLSLPEDAAEAVRLASSDDEAASHVDVAAFGPGGASTASASATFVRQHRVTALAPCVSMTRSSGTPSPAATAGTATSNVSPCRRHTNTTAMAWCSSPTRCDGWRGGECSARW